jgi:hypothetical protein
MADTPRLFQYAATPDPDAIEAVEANEDAYREWVEKGLAWARERGNSDFCKSSWGGSHHVIGVRIHPDQHVFGMWSCSDGIWRPYKRNPEYQVMTALVMHEQKVPGVPEMLEAPGERGTTTIMTPTVFIQDGLVWAGVSHQPVVGQPRRSVGYGPQWAEVLPSRFHAALEAHNAMRAARTP